MANAVASFLSRVKVDIVASGNIHDKELQHAELELREFALKYARPLAPELFWNPTHLRLKRSAHYIHHSEQDHVAVAFFISIDPISRINSMRLWATVELMKRWGLWDYVFPSPLTWDLLPSSIGLHIGLELTVTGNILPTAVEVKIIEGFAKFYNHVLSISSIVLRYEISRLPICSALAESELVSTLISGYNDFHSCQESQTALANLTMESLLEFLFNFTLPSSSQYRKLSVHIIPESPAESSSQQEDAPPSDPAKSSLAGADLYLSQEKDIELAANLLRNLSQASPIDLKLILGEQITDLLQWKGQIPLAPRPISLNPTFPN
ncbi:hypothetical protein DSO57_1008150 [Entomophthora muscae]|uniref:Uncharacterized protein n=1 Tax=Entomophthora muscae TaxID=34485 RepID=A0ACC2SKA2_9FUNG|nr:hypothetical protein DSO57_1008150 [Entomophthora muscae]